MKIVIVTVLALSLVLMVGFAAFAGEYHTGAKLRCYQCHVMHATKSHAYDDDSHDEGLGGAVTTYDHLLKEDDVNALCLECHNEGDSKDVFKGFNVAAGGTAPVVNRISGWFGLTTDANPAYTGVLPNNYGHDLNNGAQTPPGGTTGVSIDCASCHEPHGNPQYRNLKDLQGGGASAISYAKGTNDAAKDVFQATPPSGVNKFDVSNISYNAVAGSSHYEQFCVSCHTSIHSAAGGGSWLKHPTIGSTLSYTEGTVSPLKTLGGLPQAGGTGALIAGQVSCVTCHKGHGSDHPFGLVYDNRTTTALEDYATTTVTNPDGTTTTTTVSTQIRLVCKHCHDKGLVAPDAAGANGE